MEKLNLLNIPFTSSGKKMYHSVMQTIDQSEQEVVIFSELFQFWCECCLMVEVEEVSHWNDITTLKGLIF